MPLSPKIERFCQEYVIDSNGTKAAIRAGYSKTCAKVQACRMLTKDNIKARIDVLRGEIMERNKLKADDIIEELRSLGFWNIKDFLKKENEIKDISKLKRDMTRPVAGIKTKVTETTFEGVTTKEFTTELKLTDKRAALVDLGKHLGIFKEDNEQKAIKIKVTRK